MAGKKRNAKSRRNGRHRKQVPPPRSSQWLRVGVVTAGLGAAIATGPGVAGASPGAESGTKTGASGAESGGSTSGSGSTTAPDSDTQSPASTDSMGHDFTSDEDSQTPSGSAADSQSETNAVSAQQNSATADDDEQSVADLIDADEIEADGDAYSGVAEAADLDTEPSPATDLGDDAQPVEFVADADAGPETAGVVDVDAESRPATGLDEDGQTGESEPVTAETATETPTSAVRAESGLGDQPESAMLQSADVAGPEPVSVSEMAAAEADSADLADAPQVVQQVQARAETSDDGTAVDSVAQGSGALGVDSAETTGSSPRAAAEAAAVVEPRPVSLKSVVVDVLTWIGLGGLAANIDLPDEPLPTFLGALWLAVRDQQYKWNNQKPAANPTVAAQDPQTGVITGNLNATDFDDDQLTYSVGDQPEHGDVTIDAAGEFTYTPDTATAASGGQDSFTVTIDDTVGNPTHYHGLPGLLGFSAPTTRTVSVTVAPVEPPIINPPATDPPSLTQLATITVGETPVQAVVSPDGKKVYVVNSDDASLSVIDTSTRATTTINDLGDAPFAVAVSPDSKHVYVPSQTRTSTFTAYGIGTLSIIDTATNTVTKTVTVGREPVAVAASPDGKRVYVLNDEYNGNIFNGEDNPFGDSGSVTVIDSATNTVLTTVTVGVNPMGMVLSPDSSTLYVNDIGATSDDDAPSGIAVLDTASLQIVDRIAVGLNPDRMAVNPAGTQLFVTDFSSGGMFVVDTTTNTVGAFIEGPTEGLAVSPDGKYVYAAGDESLGVTDDSGLTVRGIAVIDTATNEVVSTTNVDPTLWDIAVSPDGRTLYAVSYGPGTVTVFDVAQPVADNPVLGPTIGVPNFATGAVAGTFGFIVPDDRTLTYSVTTGPTSGAVTLDDSGGFTYTPSAEARDAVLNGGPAIDTFTTTADYGNGGTSQKTTTVAIAPSVENITVQLRWGATPRDLDAHLTGPTTAGLGEFHVSYRDKTYRDGDGNVAADLLADDVTSYGPELTTIYTRTPGTYTYSVVNYSGESPLGGSGATVAVYDSVTGLNQHFGVDPTNTSGGWDVFTLNISETGGITVTPIDQFSDDSSAGGGSTGDVSPGQGFDPTAARLYSQISSSTNPYETDKVTVQLVKGNDHDYRMVVTMTGIGDSPASIADGVRGNAGLLNRDVNSFISGAYNTWNTPERPIVGLMLVGLSGGGQQMQAYAAAGAHRGLVKNIVLFGAPLTKKTSEIDPAKSVLIVDLGDQIYRNITHLDAEQSYLDSSDDLIFATGSQTPNDTHNPNTYATAAASFDDHVEANPNSPSAKLTEDWQEFGGTILVTESFRTHS